MIWILGFLVFYAINIGLTLAFRYCDLHYWIDDKTESLNETLASLKEFWRKLW
jgi:hypothetical protein